MPKVSVILPTYNNAQFLKRAIDSVFFQSFTDYELIVINDGSTDQTQNLLASYGQKLKAINQPNQERSSARNNGIHQAQGKYIAFLDDDDWWHPNKLSTQVELLETYPECVLCCSYADQITPSQEYLRTVGTDIPVCGKPFDALSWFYLGYCVPSPVVIISRQVLDKSGLFNSHLVYSEDWDLWMRIALYGNVICYPGTLAYVQLHQKYLPAVFDKHHGQEVRIEILNNIKYILLELGLSEKIKPEIMYRGYARAYWYGALIDYAVNKVESAKERALLSIDTDPSFFNKYTPASAFDMLVGFAVALYDTLTDPADAIKFVDHVEENLPSPIKSKLKFKKVYGAVSAWYGHYAYRNSQYQAASAFMGRAMLTDPALATNRGNLAVLIKGRLRDNLISL